MGYKEILESVQSSGVPPTASEAKIAAQRQKAEERQREAVLVDETWQAAAYIVALLLEREVEPNARIIATSALEKYHKWRQFEQDALTGPLNKWRMRRLRAHTVLGAWDMRTHLTTEGVVQDSLVTSKYSLYLIEDGSIAGMSGMTEKEWESGILIPGFARRSGERFFHAGNYQEVQKGLANLQVLGEAAPR